MADIDSEIRELERKLQASFPGILHRVKVDESSLARYVQLRRRVEGEKLSKKALRVYFRNGRLLTNIAGFDANEVVFRDNFIFFDAIKYSHKGLIKHLRDVRLSRGKNKHIFTSIDGQNEYYIFTPHFRKVIPYLSNGWLVGHFEFTRQRDDFGVKYLEAYE